MSDDLFARAWNAVCDDDARATEHIDRLTFAERAQMLGVPTDERRTAIIEVLRAVDELYPDGATPGEKRVASASLAFMRGIAVGQQMVKLEQETTP